MLNLEKVGDIRSKEFLLNLLVHIDVVAVLVLSLLTDDIREDRLAIGRRRKRVRDFRELVQRNQESLAEDALQLDGLDADSLIENPTRLRHELAEAAVKKERIPLVVLLEQRINLEVRSSVANLKLPLLYDDLPTKTFHRCDNNPVRPFDWADAVNLNDGRHLALALLLGKNVRNDLLLVCLNGILLIFHFSCSFCVKTQRQNGKSRAKSHGHSAAGKSYLNLS